MLHQDLRKHGMEFLRAIERHQYEVSPQGILFPRKHALVGGLFETTINGGDLQLDPNTVPVEALSYLLKAGIKGTGGLGTWYIAPFLNNITPDGSTITAATFESVLNEFTAYDELTRVAFTTPADPTVGGSASIFSNTASPAVFTASTSVGVSPGVDIWGLGILSVSAKEATTGKLLCASKLSAARNLKSAVGEQDTLTAKYTITATST